MDMEASSDFITIQGFSLIQKTVEANKTCNNFVSSNKNSFMHAACSTQAWRHHDTLQNDTQHNDNHHNN
jgi:hypothetical protein